MHDNTVLKDVKTKYKKYLVISMGDPTGIAPYIFSKLNFRKLPDDSQLIFFGDKYNITRYNPDLFKSLQKPIRKKKLFYLENIHLPGQINKFTLNKNVYSQVRPYLKKWSKSIFQKITKIEQKFIFIHVDRALKQNFLPNIKINRFKYNQPNIFSGLFSYLYFYLSREFVFNRLENGQKCCLITGPLSKECVMRSGKKFLGHTGELEKRFGGPVLMYLTTAFGKNHLKKSNMSVIPLSTHIPFKDVVNFLRILNFKDITRVLAEYKKKLNINGKRPVAILSLNPHGGESGNLGRDEIEYMNSWRDDLKECKIPAEGPFAADGFFFGSKWMKYSLILGAYHDQVLIPFKFYCGEKGVNISLGLPFLRIAPDHGPAFSLKNIKSASGESILRAWNIALEYLR